MSVIAEFYKKRTVLVTGATGYMGKVLLEKLLRSLPDLEKVYIIVRPKRGITPEERRNKLINNVIFTLNNIDQKTLNKIQVVNGDLTKDNFEMEENVKQKLIDEVSIVFHLAASVRMDLNLKEAVMINTKSTYEFFKFCMDMKNLVSVVHLSTAFCNVEVSYMEEKVYPLNVSPYNIIDMVEWMDEKSLTAIEDDLISPHPNTYTFTKRLAEIIALDLGNKLPLAVLRPSIVLPALDEPISGWVDSFNGPVGLYVAAGKGVLRVALVDSSIVPETVPVDIAINALIVCAYERTTQLYSETPVFNITQGQTHSMSWGESFDFLMNLVHKYPYKQMLWYPRIGTTKSPFLNTLYAIIFNFAPALVVDFLLIMFLQKPFLISIQRRIFVASKVLYHFSVRKWEFANVKANSLKDKLTPQENKVFCTDMANIDVKKYLTDTFFYSRLRLFNEEYDPSTIGFYRIQLKIFYVLDLALKIVVCYGLGKLIWNLLSWVF